MSPLASAFLDPSRHGWGEQAATSGGTGPGVVYVVGGGLPGTLATQSMAARGRSTASPTARITTPCGGTLGLRAMGGLDEGQVVTGNEGAVVDVHLGEAVEQLAVVRAPAFGIDRHDALLLPPLVIFIIVIRVS
jgi:hypothetical protein